MSIILFEDEYVERLHPITLGRPAYAISCGSCRLVDWILQLDLPVRSVVRPYLADLEAAEFSSLRRDVPVDTDSDVWINARLVPSASNFGTLSDIVRRARPGVVRCRGQVAAVLLPSHVDRPASGLTPAQTGDYFAVAGLQGLDELPASLEMFDYPHDVVRYHLEIIGENLQHRLARDELREVADGVFAADGATLSQHVVTDTRTGPIVLEEGASVGPFCYLRGPVHLASGAQVNPHSVIKDAVALGRATRFGGEVQATVAEAHSNKQHYGFLGHSYLGSWINLGAGTSNSDLKNTYGEVKMEYHGDRVATGQQFVGCIVGDYVKSAINTGIFTGKTIGACSMMYGFVTTNVPSFVNYARLFGQMTEVTPQVMIETQARMFRRRNVQQRPCDVQLLRDMHELTRHERGDLAAQPPSL